MNDFKELREEIVKRIVVDGDIVSLFPEREFKRKGDKWVSCYRIDGSRSEKQDKTFIYFNSGTLCENGGGNIGVIDLWMEKKGYSFIDALRALAESYSLPFPTNYNEEQVKQYKQRQDDREKANNIFKSKLWENSPEANAVISYLKGRHFSEEDIKEVEFGLITDTIKATLPKSLKEEFSGIWGNTHTLIFPYRSGSRILGFKVRTINKDEKQKYKNTTGLQKEGFFGISIVAEDLVIVEGELDAIKAKIKGYRNVVATTGGKATEEQIKDALRRGIKKVTLLYDNDEAGAGYRDRSIEDLKGIKQIQQSIYIASLPDGVNDLDEFFNTYTLDDYNKIIAEAQSLTTYKLIQAVNKYNQAPSEKAKRDFLCDVAEIYTAPYTPVVDRGGVILRTLEQCKDAMGIGVADFMSFLAERASKAERERTSIELSTATNEAQEKLKAGDLEGAKNILNKAITKADEREVEDKYISLLTPRSWADVKASFKDKPSGQPTGLFFKGKDEFMELELCTGLTYIGAQTSHGKSRMLENLALNLATDTRTDGDILYFSYEENKDDVTAELLNIYANIKISNNPLRTIKSYLSKGTFEYFASNTSVADFQARERAFISLIESGKLRIFDEHFYSNELVSFIKLISSKIKIKAIFVDYVQLMNRRGSTANRKDELKDICGDLMRLANELQLPIILACQLNRQATSPADMNVQNIAEASDIEHSANIVMLLWNSVVKPLPDNTYNKSGNKEREELEDRGFIVGEAGKIYAVLAKNRGGERGIDAVFTFKGETGKITSTEQDSGFTSPEPNEEFF
jgi:DNA primase